MKVKCKCGNIEDVSFDTSEILEVTGRPKRIGSVKCDCGQEVVVYASVYHPTPIFNSVPMEEMG